MRAASPDGGLGGGVDKGVKPAAGGGGAANARGAGLGPGAVALLSSRRAGAHTQRMRGAGSVLPLRAKSSLGLLRAADGRSPVAPRQAPVQSSPMASERTAADLGPSQSELLPPRASDPLPDFIYMPGAMPRLQSRYASKRPVPGADTAQHQDKSVEQEGVASGSRAGSRGGPRMPDPLAGVEDGGEQEADDAAPDGQPAQGPLSPLWQDSAPGHDEEEGSSEEPDSPRGWGVGGLQAADDGTELGEQQAPSSASARPYPGDIGGAAAELQPSLPRPAETLSYATDANTRDGSR
jgi:hypothetical protein